MKIALKKSFAVIMALVMCVSVLFGMNLTIFAASNTIDYVYDSTGTYIYNWGIREQEATFLSQNAEAFYNQNPIATLLALDGSSDINAVTSSELYEELHSLMKNKLTKPTSYNETRDKFQYTDCENSAKTSNKISSFYSGNPIGPDWDGGDTWNREHTWPNSKGEGQGENDIMMLRPTAKSENGGRSNTAYGESGSYYNPNEESNGNHDLRGDVARIALYQYVCWGGDGNETIQSNLWGNSGVIESKKVLLKWMQEDPVDTWELGRNDSVQSITGTRNVFVDYPELAFDLFNEDVPTGYTSPSGGTSVEGGTSGGDSGSDDTDDNTGSSTVTPGAEIVFELGANGTASHYDGSSKTSYSETVNDYTLELTNGTGFYTGARDAKGNSAIKMGAKSSAGSFSLTAPDDVIKVIFNVAGYKATAAKLSVNGTSYTVSTLSNNGEYTAIEVDTTTTKNLSFATVSGGYRCMINSITFVVAGSSSEDTETVFPDTSDDVVVSGSADAFPADTTITVTPITSGDDFDAADTALDGIASKFKAYDITAPTQPTTPVTITLDIPTGYDADFVCIAYIAEDGTVTLLDSAVNKTANTVSALVEHFSTYAVVDTSEVSSGGETVEVEATIDFTTTTQRMSIDNDSQVWSNGDLTFTNNKAASSSNVADYSNPARFYKSSEVILEFSGITKIEINHVGVSSSYVGWSTSFSDANATASVADGITTITLATPVDSFTFNSLSSQSRAYSITVYGTKTTSGGSETPEATITPTVNNTAYGSVELSGNYIIATPNEGYEVVGCEVISGTATVTQNGNKFTVETDADVTVQINFAARTQYTATFKEMGATTSSQTAYSGDSITLPAITSDDYTVVGWVAAEIDGETTDKPTVYNAGSNYDVTGNVTFYALYSRTQAGGSGESTTFTKWTEAVTEGDYIIVGAYSSSTATPYGAMNTSKNNSKNRLDYTEITVTNDTITTEDSAIIWHIASSGDGYWTIYNEAAASYAAGNGTKSLAVLITSVTDYAKWDITGTTSHVFENVGNEKAGVNYTLRRNGTSGYACYAASTGTAPVLYKRTAAAMTTYYFTSAIEAEYTVTANPNNAEYGTVTVSGTTISATPNEGYTVAGCSIASGTATVTREGNTFFVTPTSNVVITINFEALPTYTVTFVENGTEVGTDSTYSGGFIKLPEYSGELDEYTTFDGWAEQENETDSTKIYAAKATYPVTKNVTLYAQFTVTEPPVVEGDHYFIKVTEDQTDWTGTYLIVYEEGSKAFNGGLDTLDAAYNNIDVTITDGKIAATDTTLAAVFTIIKSGDNYLIKSASGYYIGSARASNYLNASTSTEYINTISFDAGVSIASQTGTTLQFNTDNNQLRFRYFSTTQQPIALYKLDVADITGAQVTIGSDLTMKYYVDVTNIENIADGDLTMRFSIDGEVIDTVTGTVVDGQYVFDFAGLAPQRMADEIKAEVLYKGTLIDVKDNYSIKTNAQNLLTENAGNVELCQFITDMLYYGAAAQKYTKYNTDNLATDGITGLGTPSTATPTETNNAFDLSATTGDAGFKSATVWFDVTNKLIVKVSKKTEDVNVKVYVTPDGGTRTELSYNDTVGGYMTDEIKVTDFHNAFVFELCDGEGNAIQTLTYSVNSYAYSIYKKYESDDTSAMKALALALFRLGQSAENL